MKSQELINKLEEHSTDETTIIINDAEVVIEVSKVTPKIIRLRIKETGRYYLGKN